MTDNQFYHAFHEQLMAQLLSCGFDVPVIAGFQPNQARGNNYLLFFPISEAALGWQTRHYHCKGVNANHQEKQLVEKTLQIQAVVDPQATLTATDLLAQVRMMVNSLPFISALAAKQIGVQRAGTIRTPYFVNDHGKYQQNYSFDINLTFSRTLACNTMATTVLTTKLHRI